MQKIKILDSAIEDLEKGRDFYDRQNIGLGDYFLDSLFSDIDSLVVYAGIHVKYLGYYRMIAKRFPYCIYYLILDKEIRVYRVLDCRMDPKKIERALRNLI